MTDTYVQNDQPDGVPPLELTGERTLPDVPEENYWYRRHLVVYEWIATRVAGQKVVDLACGEGYGSSVLADSAADVIGVDANPDAFAHAEAKYTRPGLSFRRDLVENFDEPRDATSGLALREKRAAMRFVKKWLRMARAADFLAAAGAAQQPDRATSAGMRSHTPRPQ